MVSMNFKQRSSMSSWSHWQPLKAAALGRAAGVEDTICDSMD
jgi:hypothetical protein